MKHRIYVVGIGPGTGKYDDAGSHAGVRSQ